MLMYFTIYLIVGIVYMTPIAIIGAVGVLDDIENLDVGWKNLLLMGVGMLFNILLWPLWMIRQAFMRYAD